jgi:hypothetical protein
MLLERCWRKNTWVPLTNMWNETMCLHLICAMKLYTFTKYTQGLRALNRFELCISAKLEIKLWVFAK